MDITLLSSATGKGYSLYSLVENNSCVIKEFIQGLDDRDVKQIMSLFQLILCDGIPHSEQKFRGIGDDIYELKTRSGVRILCFFGGRFLPRALILTHGFPKPKRNILVREKKRASALLGEYKSSESRIVEI